MGSHDCLDRRLDARQPFSLGPRIRTPRGMALDRRNLTKVQLRLQVLHAYSTARHQPSSRLINRPLSRFPCRSDSPVDTSTFESPPTSTPNSIQGRGEGEDISATFCDNRPGRNLAPSVAPTTRTNLTFTFEGDTLVRYPQRTEAGEAFYRAKGCYELSQGRRPRRRRFPSS